MAAISSEEKLLEDQVSVFVDRSSMLDCFIDIIFIKFYVQPTSLFGTVTKNSVTLTSGRPSPTTAASTNARPSTGLAPSTHKFSSSSQVRRVGH